MRKYLCTIVLTLCASLGCWAQSARTSAFGEVNHYLYNDNMTIICQVKQGTKVVTDCELAVFDSKDELRGKSFSHVSEGGLIFLTVQGEGSTALHFQASIGGTVYDIEETLNFSANQMVGELEAPQTFTLSPLKGDINGDGKISIADVTALIRVLIDKVSSPVADVDGNGTVDLQDVMALRKKLLQLKN